MPLPTCASAARGEADGEDQHDRHDPRHQPALPRHASLAVGVGFDPRLSRALPVGRVLIEQGRGPHGRGGRGVRIGPVDHAREQERARRRQRVGGIGDGLAHRRRIGIPIAGFDRAGPVDDRLEWSERLARDDRLQRARRQCPDRGVGREREVTGDALHEDQRERIEVGARVELRSLGLFRRRVARGAEHRARGFGPARLGQRAGESEVGDADDAVLVEQEVRGLDVAVQHAAAWAYSSAEATSRPTRAACGTVRLEF